MDSKLEHKALNRTEDGDVFKVASVDEIVKTISTLGCPISVYLDDKVTFGGGKFDSKRCWSFFVGFGRIHQASVIRG